MDERSTDTGGAIAEEDIRGRQKLEILREWEETGNGVEAAKRHGIPPMTESRTGMSAPGGEVCRS